MCRRLHIPLSSQASVLLCGTEAEATLNKPGHVARAGTAYCGAPLRRIVVVALYGAGVQLTRLPHRLQERIDLEATALVRKHAADLLQHARVKTQRFIQAGEPVGGAIVLRCAQCMRHKGSKVLWTWIGPTKQQAWPFGT